MITVDFVNVTFKFFGDPICERYKSDDIDSQLLPRKGDYVYIDKVIYKVEQVTIYPLGDENGKKGAKVFISKTRQDD